MVEYRLPNGKPITRSVEELDRLIIDPWVPDSSDDLLVKYLDKIASEKKLADRGAAARYLLDPKTREGWEVGERMRFYQELGQCLMRTPISFQEVAEFICKDAAADAILGGFAGPRVMLREFLEKENQAGELVEKLIGDRKLLPAIERIDEFINAATQLAFHKKPGKKDLQGRNPNPREIKPDRPQAAMFASVLLTAVYPDNFVDYKQTRWDRLAERFKLGSRKQNATLGESIIWAGQIAKRFAQLKTFQEFFSADHTNWTVAGLAWLLNRE